MKYLLLLLVLCSCSKTGIYKAYPIQGGDTITVKHKKYDGYNTFNTGEPVSVNKRKHIVDPSTNTKLYVILKQVK